MENNDEKKLQENLVENTENVVEKSEQNQSETSTDSPKEVKKESAADVILRKIAESKKNSAGAENTTKEAPKLKITEQEVKTQASKKDSVPEEEDEQEAEYDYSKSTVDELLADMKQIAQAENFEETKEQISAIKTQFYKLHNALVKTELETFVAEGGNKEEFVSSDNQKEEEFKTLLQAYKDAKALHIETQQKVEIENKNKKVAIIEQIEGLINSEDDFNKIFDKFRDLQTKWHEIGPVPKNSAKDIWDNYHRVVEAFYDYAKINKELRDLDLKKNQDRKIELCERAEELMLKEKVVEAFRELQILHERWREIGPVPRENKEELWERFKTATKTINKKHQDYFENLKEEQENNLKAKQLLTDEARRISLLDLENHKDWNEKTDEIIELQKIWRLIGFAPKKYNNKIYQEFREACDAFFENKREYYSRSNEVELQNLEKKIELCRQAESLQNSTDWQKTSDILKKLQHNWKKIGTVPRKDSDAIWKRFRAACNTFFDNKEQHHKGIENEQNENLKKKEELIETLKNFKVSENAKESFNQLKQLQKQWAEIGYVPFKQKDTLYKTYKAEVDRIFDQLKIDEKSKREMQFKNKLEEMKQMPRGKFRAEKDRIRLKIDQIQSDIILWENNLGFFAKSKNAESMIKDFSHKIEAAKTTVKQLKKELKEINALEKEQ